MSEATHNGVMDDTATQRTFRLTLGSLNQEELTSALQHAGVQLNTHARTLLDQIDVQDGAGQSLTLTEVSVADLGLSEGGSLSAVFAAAEVRGLGPCPAATAPYLRLAWSDQRPSSHAELPAGRAPDGSVTVASLPPSADDEDPKGFYLRVLEGVSWLRGYRCDDEHRWAATDRFVFCQAKTVPAQRVM